MTLSNQMIDHNKIIIPISKKTQALINWSVTYLLWIDGGGGGGGGREENNIINIVDT